MSIEVDNVIKLLVEFALPNRENEYRGILATLTDREPNVREASLAMLALLMAQSGIHWPAVTIALNRLNKLPDEQLASEGAVAVVNGSYLVVSAADGTSLCLDITRFTEVEGPIEAIVSCVFSVVTIWDKVTKVFTA